MTLTKTDLAALRKADSICFDTTFRYDLSQGYRRHDFEAQIRAVKRTSEKEKTRDPFAPYDRTHYIACEAHLNAYAFDDSSVIEHRRILAADKAFHMIHSANFCDHWRGILAFLRVGDDLVLRWTADNNNRLVSNASLHVDQLELEIQRTTKAGRTLRYVFLIDFQVSANNSARMINGRYPPASAAA